MVCSRWGLVLLCQLKRIKGVRIGVTFSVYNVEKRKGENILSWGTPASVAADEGKLRANFDLKLQVREVGHQDKIVGERQNALKFPYWSQNLSKTSTLHYERHRNNTRSTLRRKQWDQLFGGTFKWWHRNVQFQFSSECSIIKSY